MVKPPLRTKSIGFKVSEEEYAFLEYGGSSDYLHKDWLGNARIASLIAGQTIGADLAYAPYGEVYNFIAGASGDWMFTGDVTQLDSEYLFDTPNREFAAKNQGRWLSPDPAGTGWNQYAYATNPLISVDPSGLACYPLEKQIFGTCAGFGLLGDDNGGYTLDGVDAPVWLVMSLLNGGTAIQCPNNNCSFVRTGPNGQFQQYVPYPTTQSGLTIYTGNGSWINVSQGSVFQTSGAANNSPVQEGGSPPIKLRIGTTNYIFNGMEGNACRYDLFCPNGNTAATCKMSPVYYVPEPGGAQCMNYAQSNNLVVNGVCTEVGTASMSNTPINCN
jgi:RHS repeat-associated protein